MFYYGNLLGIRKHAVNQDSYTSFSDDAVISIADKVKLILNSDKYKNLFGWVEIRKDVNNKHNLKPLDYYQVALILLKELL